MTAWPADHPGRTCGLCGVRRYPIWIGDTPPPGACTQGCSDARACAEVLSDLLLSRAMAEFQGRPWPTSHAQAVLELTGITTADIEREAAFQAATVVAETALRRVALTIDGMPVEEWLRDDATAGPRFVALIKVLRGMVDFCDGKRSLLDLNARYEDLHRRACLELGELLHQEYELDDGE